MKRGGTWYSSRDHHTFFYVCTKILFKYLNITNELCNTGGTFVAYALGIFTAFYRQLFGTIVGILLELLLSIRELLGVFTRGRTPGFGPGYGGSNPSPRTISNFTTSLNPKSISIRGLDHGAYQH